jgi:outer membrane protein assembly factor BamD (BamD/ComL family)
MNLHAQKAKVVTAYNYYNYKEFDKAKAAIDEASVNEQSANMEKTWYYRGMIYLAIAGDAKFKAATPNALEEASKSYNKVLELNPKSEYKKDAEQALVSIKALVFNEGLDAYNAKDFNLALSRFFIVQNISSDLKISFYKALKKLQDNNNIDQIFFDSFKK